MLIEIIENNNKNNNFPIKVIFNLQIKLDNEEIGNLTVFEHPDDKKGGQVHIEIIEKWRRNWVSRNLKNKLMEKLKEKAKNYNLSILYSTALTKVSPRLLAFAGFIEYNYNMPKTYYYLLIN
jgi:CRISPR/Cas system-associated endonuclease/helicase Cas3